MSPWRTQASVSAGLVCVTCSYVTNMKERLKRRRLNETFQETKTPVDSKFNSQMFSFQLSKKIN